MRVQSGGFFDIAGRVVALARNERWRIAAIVALGLLAAIFEGLGLSLAVPLAHIALADDVSTDVPYLTRLVEVVFGAEVSAIALLFLCGVAFVIGRAIGVLNLVLSTRLALLFAERLRARIFDRVMRKQVAELERQSSGKLLNIMITESWRACDALFVVIAVVVESIAILVLAVFLVSISPFYSILLAGLTMVMAAVTMRMTRRMRHIGGRATAANEGLTSYLVGVIEGLRVVRGFGREIQEQTRFDRRSAQVSAAFTRLKILAGLVNPIAQLLIALIVGILILVAYMRGDQPALLIGFLAVAYRLQLRISNVLTAHAGMLGFDAPVSEIERALAVGTVASEARRRMPTGPREIRFENVSVIYPGTEIKALRDLSCTFAAGQITAIAGRSGAGKSTIVAQLLRFVLPSEGVIKVDDVPLQEIDAQDWHRRIAFVEQDAYLFRGTVRANIAYARPDAPFSEVIAAAQSANADGFIGGLDKGYSTFLGERGSRLSQGQRQRIALARALLRNPDVLILDEATNALDLITERKLRGNLLGPDRSRIVILIAHRKETIDFADRVLVLDHGRLVQQGSPADLASCPGVYAELHRTIA